MSITNQLDKAAFPLEYAETLIETLAITPDSFRDVKDALYHFRRLDGSQAAEITACILEALET